MSDARDRTTDGTSGGPKPAWIPPMEFDPAHAVPAPAEESGAQDGALEGEVLPPPRRLRAAKVLAGSLALLVLVAIGFDTADLIGRAFALSPWLGGALSGLGALAVGSLGLLAGREARAYLRLQQVDALRIRALSLRAAGGHGAAAPLMRRITGLYAGRGDLDAAGRTLAASVTDAHDDREVLDLTEATLLAPLDRSAYRLVLKASRDVALGTMLSPSALLDTALVLWRTMKLLREVASLYAARPGLVGSARLLRRMVENMGIAGLAESGDSLVAEALGAGAVGAVSARLGQGLVNGLLVARIGLTAMHLCRPLPFAEDRRPKLTDIRKALLALPKERR